MKLAEQQLKEVRQHNYRQLKELIIAAMRDREGILHVNYEAATDIAWYLAVQLPGDMRIEKVLQQSVQDIIKDGRVNDVTRWQIRQIEIEQIPSPGDYALYWLFAALAVALGLLAFGVSV